jgi:hypothetical protein
MIERRGHKGIIGLLIAFKKKTNNMKKITFLLLMCGATLAHASAPQPSPQNFDGSMELFREALETGHIELAEQFFADSVSYERDDGRIVKIPKALVLAALEADLNASMSPDEYLLVLTKGFSQVTGSNGNAYVNAHAGLHQPELITVNVSSVNFRKLPSTKAPIICLLENGVYSGKRDNSRPVFKDESTGIEWTPLRLYHTQIGSVKGYVASNLVTIENKHVPREMTVQNINGQWKITDLKSVNPMLCAQ